MKYEIQLDENNYVSAIVHNGDEKGIYDDKFIFNTFYKDSHRINCYHLVDGEYILDEAKEQEEIAKEQEEAKKPSQMETIEAQVLYTALITDSMLKEEVK